MQSTNAQKLLDPSLCNRTKASARTHIAKTNAVDKICIIRPMKIYHFHWISLRPKIFIEAKALKCTSIVILAIVNSNNPN